MVETRRLRELESRLVARLDLPDGELVIALSGGADSACLAYLVGKAGRRYRALHVNHGLSASPLLEKAARAVADELGASIEVLTVEVPEGSSPEDRARQVRYEALLGGLRPGELLLTAHTLDDQAETVLLNLLRGAGAAGLSGIPARQGVVVRPMLGITRGETRETAALASLPYYDDPTNLDQGIRRNALRLQTLPELRARFNPQLNLALVRAAGHLARDEEYLQREAGRIPVVRSEGEIRVPVSHLQVVPRPIADRALRASLADLRPPHRGTTSELERVWEVVEGERAGAVLGDRIEVSRSGPMLVLRTGPSSATAELREELTPGRHPMGELVIEVELVDGVCRALPIGKWSAVFPPDARLVAVSSPSGGVVVWAGDEPAWVPGERRLPVAWYDPGSSGYLCLFAREDRGWTSSP